jgi:hypothetical protein
LSNLIRFQYGGHATFPVRYGWLPKGASQLRDQGSFVANAATADDLGLGSKMVDSLAYWLEMTGIGAPREGRRSAIEPSPLNDLILKCDPHFELPGTWWFLHLALARREGTVWSWFFNEHPDRIFDRIASTDAFLQFTRSHAVRPATPSAAQRDVACLISSYAARPGVDVVDPSDVGACPLRELGLIIRHDAVSRFERTRSPHAVPVEAFLASASALASDLDRSALSLRELASVRGGPGRVLCMGFDAIEEMVGRIGGERWSDGIGVETSAGERHLVVSPRDHGAWLADLYGRVATRTRRAAA